MKLPKKLSSTQPQPSWEEEFETFIKKWCGVNAGHLLDNDENDGQRLRESISKQIAEAEIS